MWSDVRKEFTDIISTRVFLNLRNDAEYLRFLENAGLKGVVPRELTALRPDMRSSVEQAARMLAHIVTRQIEEENCVRERRAKAIVLEGPVSIYRVWSQKHNTRHRAWWFSQGVLDGALLSAAGDRNQALEWLRNRLAISLDRNDADRLARITLPYGEALPIIAAWGLPMPQYSIAAATQKGTNMRDYWARQGAVFQGEKTQYFLPFIPAQRVVDYW
ncbi:MAG: hypothetical protein H7039_07385 [Bryobacteraceae bacterium]|nr:hypothetical protein [Bryobacteraceae bacterium]